MAHATEIKNDAKKTGILPSRPAAEVFCRYENKYIITKDQMETFLELTKDHIRLDDTIIAEYDIMNIYYDTENFTIIRGGMLKPSYKEKVRLRSYGPPGPDDFVFIEIKKKVRGLVSKRRSAIKPAEAYHFLETGIMPEPQPYLNMQTLREIKYIMDNYQLKPAAVVSYHRKAYMGIENPDIRITFDSEIISRKDDLELELGMHGRRVVHEDIRILEVKVLDAVPMWLCRILSDMGVFRTGFSKYGTHHANRNRTDDYIPEFVSLQTDTQSLIHSLVM